MSDDNTGVDEIRTLLQHDSVRLADGREVRVHAYGFVDSLKVGHLAGPLLRELQAYFDAARAGGGFDLAGLQACFAADPDALVELLAYASDLTCAEVSALSDADGALLMWAWWGMNQDFFVRRLVEEAGAKAALNRLSTPAPRGSLPT